MSSWQVFYSCHSSCSFLSFGSVDFSFQNAHWRNGIKLNLFTLSVKWWVMGACRLRIIRMWILKFSSMSTANAMHKKNGWKTTFIKQGVYWTNFIDSFLSQSLFSFLFSGDAQKIFISLKIFTFQDINPNELIGFWNANECCRMCFSAPECLDKVTWSRDLNKARSVSFFFGFRFLFSFVVCRPPNVNGRAIVVHDSFGMGKPITWK